MRQSEIASFHYTKALCACLIHVSGVNVRLRSIFAAGAGRFRKRVCRSRRNQRPNLPRNAFFRLPEMRQEDQGLTADRFRQQSAAGDHWNSACSTVCSPTSNSLTAEAVSLQMSPGSDISYHSSSNSTTLDASGNQAMTDAGLTVLHSVSDPAVASLVGLADQQLNVNIAFGDSSNPTLTGQILSTQLKMLRGVQHTTPSIPGLPRKVR